MSTTLYKAPKSGAATIKPIMERILTFDDACKELNVPTIQLDLSGMDKDGECVTAFLKLIIIARALNEGWEPDWSNSNEYKYCPWFIHKTGFGLAYHGIDDWVTFTTVGSRLCFKSRELAEYAGKQFESIYIDYLTIKK